jgi:hypothetical protein
MERRIEPHMIDAFLHDEHGYAFDPSNKDNNTTRYIKRGFPAVTVPNQDYFSEDEIIGKVLSRPMFIQLMAYLEKIY